MGESNLCLKITFLAVQLVFVACGLALIGLGIYLEIVDMIVVQAIQNSAFLAGPYLLIAVGAAILVVAVLGIVGGICSKKCNRVFLVLYIVIVFFIFVAEIAGGIIAFVFRAQVESVVVDGLSLTIRDFYNTTGTTASAVVTAVDSLQQQFMCCGIGDNGTLSIDPFWDQIQGGVPASCCVNRLNPCVLSSRFNQTCNSAVTAFVENNLLIVAVVGIVLILAEVLVFLLAICLCYSTEYS